MGLSLFQMAAIAGGEAFGTASKIERERKNNVVAALTKTIDDAKAPAGEYRQKHMLVQSKAKEQLKQIMDTYLTKENVGDLAEPQRVVLANALWAKHGFKVENINKNYQSSLTRANALSSKSYTIKDYITSQFGKGSLNNTKGMTLDSAINVIAQNKIGAPPITTETFKATSSTLDTERGFFTSGINVNELADQAKKSFGLPDLSTETIPTVDMRPTTDSFEVLKNVQKYKMNEKQMATWQSTIDGKADTTMSDWQKLYKVAANNAIAASTLDIKIIDEGGVLSYKMPGGQDQAKIKREVERNVLLNFVLGAMGSNRLKDKNFLSYVQNVGANVQGINISDMDKTSPPIVGMTYTNGLQRYIYTGIDTGQKDNTNKPIYYTIPLLSSEPKYK